METHDEVCILGLDVLQYPGKNGVERSTQPDIRRCRVIASSHRGVRFCLCWTGGRGAGTCLSHLCIPENRSLGVNRTEDYIFGESEGQSKLSARRSVDIPHVLNSYYVPGICLRC